MKRSFCVQFLSAACALALFGCTTTPDPGSNSNSNTNTNTNNNSSGNSKFTLSASVVNAEGPSRGPDVRIFAADQTFDRLNAPYGGPLQVFSLRGSDEAGFTQQDIQIDAGMIVTMVALESRGGTTTIFEGQDESGLQSINNAEFVSFVPDSMAGITFREERDSVMSFTMDRDISVVANYRQMPSLRVAFEGDEVVLFGSVGPFEVETPKWLTLPEALPEGGFDCPIGLNGVSNETIGTLGRIFLAQAQTGTEIQLTAGDLEGSGFTFGMWSVTANNCGGNRTCTLVLGMDSDVTATWNAQ